VTAYTDSLVCAALRVLQRIRKLVPEVDRCAAIHMNVGEGEVQIFAGHRTINAANEGRRQYRNFPVCPIRKHSADRKQLSLSKE
jgi:hypothetical protein